MLDACQELNGRSESERVPRVTLAEKEKAGGRVAGGNQLTSTIHEKIKQTLTTDDN